jgi:hypothetical protein
MIGRTLMNIIELQLIQQVLKPNELDVRVIRLIIELHNKIIKCKNPTFHIRGIQVMQYWDEFCKMGLTPLDYIYYNFYLKGMPDDETRDLTYPINLQVNNIDFVDLDDEKIIIILSTILSEMDEHMDVYFCKTVGDLYYGINKYELDNYNFTENGKSVMQN